MKFYLAPLEGITGHIYRNALEKYFPGVDRYFTPFIAPDQNRILRTKEQRDVLPENNHVADLVPQILTNNAEDFLKTAAVLCELGYEEVNLNLGCPSGTVVSRRRGSGLLAYPDELDRLLEQIFDGTDLRISIKTRIGRDDEKDAFALMEVYRKYPLSELIIHPRTQKEFYRGEPHRQLFGKLVEALGGPAKGSGAGKTLFPVCYNGNILTEKNYRDFEARFPFVPAVMLGRGAIANPGLIRQIRTGQTTDKQTLLAFHDEVLEGYRGVFGEDKNALFRMKEMWIYMLHLFADSEKYGKKIRKAQSLAEYRCAVDALFTDRELLPDGPERWNLPLR